MSEAPSPFSDITPNFQTSWDSTSLGWFKSCPTKYYYQKLLNRSPRSKSIHLTFGGYYAAALERYSHSRAIGDSHDLATLKMAKWAMVETKDWTPAPDDPYATYKNRYTLIRSLIWNVEDRLHSPFTTLILSNGKPAVELSFRFEAFEVSGETIFLCGHLDEVVEADGDVWVRDDKTTKNALNAQYFANYTPDNQMSLYSIAGGIILSAPIRGVLVRACQVGVNFNRFATHQVPRPKAMLDEWMKDAQLTIQAAHKCAVENHWPMNDKSCFGCEFRKVCSVSPSHRQAWLDADFEERNWNPLESRGEI